MEWKQKLTSIYGEETASKYEAMLEERINQSIGRIKECKSMMKKSADSIQEVVLITYPDQFFEKGVKKLQTFSQFADLKLKGVFDVIHLLPFYPYSSDDGFSVIDYKKVDESLGDWEDIKHLNQDYVLMYDFVCNHISAKSQWFKEYVNGNPEYENFFVAVELEKDLSHVVRPRTSPLLTEFDTAKGKEYLWTTFSADQVDLNYENPKVLYRVIDVFLDYLEKGAEWIRLDAVGFIWKEIGTTCIHLPETHIIIKLMREIMNLTVPNGKLITETNVPHKENISYFGNGHDESHLVYQFPLPPLVLYSFFRKNSKVITTWATSLEIPSEETGFFNFLASHDGVGINPLRSIVEEQEINRMITYYKDAAGALVSYKENPDGSKAVYEMNVTYLSALEGRETEEAGIAKFLTAHGILLGLIGIPAIYIHSYIGSENNMEGVFATEISRTINREKYELSAVVRELNNPNSKRHHICNSLQKMIRIRKSLDAFDMQAPQKVLNLDERVLVFLRQGKLTNVLCLYNFADEEVMISYSGADGGLDVFRNTVVAETIILGSYEFRWISI